MTSELRADLKDQIEKSSSAAEKMSSELKSQIGQLDSKVSAFNETFISLKATTERVIMEVDNLERRR